MILTIEDHVSQLSYFLHVFGECLEDVRRSRNGVPIYYNVDFSLLCPILFSSSDAPPGSKEFLVSTKESMRRVLDKKPEEGHYKLVVSGPTVIEFFDQLDHLLRYLEQRIPALSTQFGIKDEALLRSSFKTSKEIQRDLRDLPLLTQKGLDERVRAPINKLLKLLDDGAVRGIGDVLDEKTIRAETSRSVFDRFVAEQGSRRRTGDNRAIDDRTFHYKIDAANNCLTLAASKIAGVSVPFVTTTPLNVQQCTVGSEVFARLDRTPLFLLNLHQLKQSRQIGDEIHFLNIAAREAIELLAELPRYSSLHEVPSGVQLRLARFYFYDGPIALLNKGYSGEADKDQERDVDEILKNLSDPSRIRGFLKDAVQDVKDGARLIELHKTKFDLPYLDQFDFANDPVIERIKNDLGVNLKQ
jgi:hypothetical protein